MIKDEQSTSSESDGEEMLREDRSTEPNKGVKHSLGLNKLKSLISGNAKFGALA